MTKNIDKIHEEIWKENTSKEFVLLIDKDRLHKKGVDIEESIMDVSLQNNEMGHLSRT